MRDFSWALGDVCLPDRLESVYSLGVLLPDLHNLSKATFADDLEQIEGFDSEWFIANGLEVYFKVEGPGSGCGAVPLVRGMLLRRRM